MEQDTIHRAETTHGVEAFERDFGSDLTELAKILGRLTRYKKLGDQPRQMNLFDLRKQLDETLRLAKEVEGASSLIQERLAHFQAAATEEDQVEWEMRFKQAFSAGYPPVEGEFPAYQIFPVEVRVDFDHELVLVNNRTVRTLHPEAVAGQVQKQWDRLNGERFNAHAFAKTLIAAYKFALSEQQTSSQGKNRGRAVTLKSLHRILTLRGGLSAYPSNQFAFDLYRLRRSEHTVLDGQRLEFGTTRNRGGFVITFPGGRRETLGSLEVVEVDTP